ncbi:hybrid non-ribosomal peptide synthetase/type I polyketide synthase [Desulfoluna spongiiphila]|uniref:Amino acid adenylation domain-containing protein n=1 Tax=Desulfoluna spongiiphila TaxID=419481 RepID=A0A1G5C3G9_9BACT|nr:hybrid non-ribosomal peptide synthetase/type I polyketide synthase [Desulfoluna spongiiphila]SCX96952.1 amino acid adenylation domain-containing protein [Desulfoluna spongiiphila]
MSQVDQYANAIAVVGMSGRFPGASSCEAFWENLVNGVESITVVSDEALKKHELDYDAVKDDPSYVAARGIIDGADLFDAGFFGFNPREASLLDPQHRLWLECVWETLERAGYDPETYEGVIGLFGGGSFIDSYFLHNITRNHDHLERMIRQRTPDGFAAILSNRMEFLTTRTSHRLNLKGPSVNIQTGCSTSLVSVYYACQSLLNYDSDLCLAGGVSVIFPQESGYLYQEGAINSPDGHCRPFDAKAQGTVFSGGVGVVALKRMEDALADGDQVIAVIKGVAVNNDGSQKIGYAAPSVQGQAEVIAMAHAAAEVEPETISYVEAHGTATPLGDPIEVAALTKAFRMKTDARRFCGIGSVKSNIGHSDAAAGVVGLIKASLCLQHGKIPASLHFQSPNPEIDFENSPFYVVDRPMDWAPEHLPRRAGVSSFGIGGTNAHAVLEEGPEPPPSGEERPWKLMLLSAKTETALEAQAERLADCLASRGEVPLGDVAYTLQVGRQDMAVRRAFICRDAQEAIAAARQEEGPWAMTRTPGRRDPSVVFMFSGQGSQYVRMGHQVYECEPVFQETLDRCAEGLVPHLGLDIREILFPAEGQEEEATRRLARTELTQPCLFAVEYALAELWQSWGVRPDAMIGHSIGEYVAATLAGVFSLEDALAVVATRGRLMQQMPEGSMRALRLSVEELTPLLTPGIALAAVNAPSLCVVSGAHEHMEAFEQALAAREIDTTRLHTSHAFHSEMMEPALASFAEALEGVSFHPPELPFISNVTGTWITEEMATDPGYWVSQLRRPVLFSDGIRELQKVSGRVLIEVGPGTALSTSARQHPNREAAQTVISSLGHAKERLPALACLLKALGEYWLSGGQVDWEGFSAAERRQRILLPTYPFERTRHWIEPADRAPAGDVTEVPVSEEAVHAAEVPEASLAPRQETGTDAIVARLKEIMHELSGIDFNAFSPSVTFLEMGMDSLFLTQVSNRLKSVFGVTLGFRHLVGEYATFPKLAAFIESALAESVPARPAAEAPEQAREPADGAETHGITRFVEDTPWDGNAPLSSMQKRLWYVDQINPLSPVYSLPFAIRFSGAVDGEVMRRSLQAFMDRHDALRTTFAMDGDVPVQVVAPSQEIDFAEVDYSTLPAESREQTLAGYLETEAARPLDLAKGPLVRAGLVTLSDTEHVLFFMPHHSIFDGISFVIFQRELFVFYEAFATGSTPDLPTLPITYPEYSRWQQEAWLSSEAYQRQLAYWKHQLAGDLPVLQLPADFPRPAEFSGRGATETLVIPEALAAPLEALARREGATLFMIFLAAFKALLYRYTSQEELCVGSPFANRVHGETEEIVGFFTNTLVLRTACGGTLTFTELLGRVKEVCLDAYNHQEMPFERLVQELNPHRDLSMTALYQVLFVFLGDMEQDRTMGGVSWREEPVETHVAQTDLMCTIGREGTGMKVAFEYATDLFSVETIKRLLESYAVLLEGIVAEPSAELAKLPVLSASEQALLGQWNETATSYPREACIHGLFEAQVERHPDAPAVSCDGVSLTYGELNERAEAIAAHLRISGVGPDVLVGICVERSADMLAGLLGILKAGGAYVPLDPEYPAERLAYMVESAKVSVLLTEGALLANLPENSALVICLDRDILPGQAEGMESAWEQPEPGHLAYVIFTSGSTGKPKGVQVPHGTVVNFLTSMARTPGLGPRDILMAVTTLSFDIAVLELFLPLSVGAQVVIAGRETARDGLELVSALKRSGTTVMQATPGTWRLLLAAGWEGSDTMKILCGGEAFPPDLAEELTGRVAEVWNMYGPTETTVWSTCCLLDRDGGPIHVGRPIANTQIHILDRQMQPLPVGVPGELFIGGDGVTRGYLDRPELTAERFIPDPFAEDPGARLYRTGDLARFHPDGSIEYLSRMDNQVKVRGFRIEPGEIEASLTDHEAVRQGIVTVREESAGDVRLVAHLLYEQGASATGSQLRKHLRKTLPDYMIPQHFIEIDQLPLTPAGKIDRKKIQESFSLGTVQTQEFVAPETESEKILAGIWQEELGIARVGVHDNFFDAGGHSLLAIRVIARVLKETGVRLSPRDIFLNTLGQIAARYPFAESGDGNGPGNKLRQLWEKVAGALKPKEDPVEVPANENRPA